MSSLFPVLYSGSNGRELTIDYLPTVSNVDKLYPESDTYEMLGQLYAPRIYGKDLTAFELGSSGKIAMTLRDTHALDFDRDDPTKTVSLRTLAGDTLLISLDNSNAGSILIGQNSNVVITAGNSLTGTASNISFSATSNITVAASNNVAIAASNNFTADAASNVTVTAGNSVSTAAGSNINLVAASNVNVSASNSFVATAASNVELSAASNVVVSATQSIIHTAGSNYAITAASNVNITSSDGDITLSAPNGKLYIQASNLDLGMNGDFSLVSGSNSLSFSNDNATLSSGGELVLNGDLQVSLRSGSNYLAISPSNAVFYTRIGDIDIAAATATGDGEARITFGNSNNRTLSMQSTTENGSNLSFFNLDGSNVTALASGDYKLYVGTSTATGTPALELSTAQLNATSTQHQWYLGSGASEPTLRLYKDASGDPVMQLKGRLDIDGEINTITSTELKVNDKTITLAANEDGVQVYDGNNSAAGLLVNGIPNTPGFSNDPDPMDANDVTERYYEKSLLWVHGSEGGIDKLGTSDGVNYSTGTVNESRWEMRGGHLQLTLPKSTGDGKVRDVTFGLRVNERMELELYKRSWENGAYKARRLTRWGHGNGML